MALHKIIVTFMFGVLLTVPAFATLSQMPERAFSYQADKFRKTELYFGIGKPDGTEVTEEEWQDFLLKEVTPRFPDGFTVIAATGQYRTAAGQVVREHSRVIVILYPKRMKAGAGVKIEELRKVYCERFKQESVIRVDLRHSVDVDF